MQQRFDASVEKNWKKKKLYDEIQQQQQQQKQGNAKKYMKTITDLENYKNQWLFSNMGIEMFKVFRRFYAEIQQSDLIAKNDSLTWRVDIFFENINLSK